MKGILMTPANHLATRKKVKTMTRRLDGLKEINQSPNNWDYMRTNNDGRALFWRSSDTASAKFNDTDNIRLIRPRYQVGEVVYIKEAYWQDSRDKMICRDADRVFMLHPDDNRLLRERYNGTANPEMLSLETNPNWRKKSPLLLPAWAARDFIKITRVGIGRVKNISYSDCLAEGIEPCHVPQIAFQQLWDSINKKYPFNFNPWNWEISYELLESKP